MAEKQRLFWGLKIAPGPKGTSLKINTGEILHITSATLTPGNVDPKHPRHVVFVESHQKQFVLCTLRYTTQEQVPLNLMFGADDHPRFLVSGDAPVHLLGYTLPEDNVPMDGDDEDEDELMDLLEEGDESEGDEGEADEESQPEPPTPTPAAQKGKRKAPEAQKPAAAATAAAVTEQPAAKKAKKTEAPAAAPAPAPAPAPAASTPATPEAPKKQQQQQKNKKEQQQQQQQAKETPKAAEQPKKKAEEKKSEEKAAPAAVGQTTVMTLPGGVRVQEVKIGTGAVAKKGQNLSVRYKGMLQDGTVFDSNMPRGRPFNFKLGNDDVINGWHIGFEGMRVGGRRNLEIPPKHGYGARGSPPEIPPQATLIFEVELLDAK